MTASTSGSVGAGGGLAPSAPASPLMAASACARTLSASMPEAVISAAAAVVSRRPVTKRVSRAAARRSEASSRARSAELPARLQSAPVAPRRMPG